MSWTENFLKKLEERSRRFPDHESPTVQGSHGRTPTNIQRTSTISTRAYGVTCHQLHLFSSLTGIIIIFCHPSKNYTQLYFQPTCIVFFFYTSNPPRRICSSSVPSVKPNKPSRPRGPDSSPQPPPFTPPPSSLLHPTLLEKMRLGSPSSAHIHLSTLNRPQSSQSISETFYSLQDSAPFPRLPPYYVHKPADLDVHRTMYKHSGGVGVDGDGKTLHTKTRPTSSGTRPPSGRSHASVSFPNPESMSTKANRVREGHSESHSEIKGQENT